MKYSAKSNPPDEFIEWLELENDEWKPTYDALSGAPRVAVVQALAKEQGFVCCYCGRRVDPLLGDCHIDHFWPQHFFDGTNNPDLTLSYQNFFLSCGPKGAIGVPPEHPITCGDAKADWHDAELAILPSDPIVAGRFSFGQSGQIFASFPDDAPAEAMIQKLALDDIALNVERAELIVELERVLANNVEPEEELARMSTPVDGRLPSFGHVAARYLEIEYDL